MSLKHEPSSEQVMIVQEGGLPPLVDLMLTQVPTRPSTPKP